MTGSTASASDKPVDVTICGGGLAGLTLALQLRQMHPGLSLVVLERTSRPLPEACHKVGESSVEIGSSYFERLGLKEYLLKHQLVKFGLRFFPGGGTRPVEERVEIGPMQDPIVNSYQLDRGTFESDLRGMAEAQGADLREGSSVQSVELGTGGALHTVHYERNGEKQSLMTKWLVDATGRHALLRKHIKLTRRSPHVASSGWFRIAGKFDINELVPETCRTWHDNPTAKDRWRSTNHFMGEGYWAWVIPLASGKTSIGLVIHEDTHSFDTVRTEAGVREFLAKHEPILGKALETHPSLDFLCLKNYSHTVGRAWSADRWAMVGEAGAFVDPFYSPGSDFIAFANSFTEDLIRLDFAGQPIAEHVNELNLQYRALIAGSIEVYRRAAVVLGHAQAMPMKVYWDNFAYWSYPAQYFMQDLYRLTGPAAARFAPLGQRFVELSDYAQGMLQQWAFIEPGGAPAQGFCGIPKFPSVLVDAHLALREKWTPDQTFEYMTKRSIEGEEILGELLLRVLGHLGEERGRKLIAQANVHNWNIRIPADRLDRETLLGLDRRKEVSRLVLDIDRTLGRAERSVSPAVLADMLGPILGAARPAARPEPTMNA